MIIGNRSERIPRLIKELEAQGITDYELWDGIFERSNKVKENINAAHRQIVEYADVAGWEECCIAEDDVKFCDEGAWDFFLKNKPKDFDIYLAGIYTGEIKEDNTTDYFCGFHLYIVNQRFYKKYLSVDKHDHIDRGLKGMGKFVVCQPFAAIQYEGFSANTGKDEVYEQLLQGRQLFKK